jgi:hypothetical protein
MWRMYNISNLLLARLRLFFLNAYGACPVMDALIEQLGVDEIFGRILNWQYT